MFTTSAKELIAASSPKKNDPESVEPSPVRQTESFEKKPKEIKRVTQVSKLGGLGISIKGGTKESDLPPVEAEANVNKIIKTDRVTQEQLLDLWNELITEVATDKVLLTQTLQTHLPKLADDGVTITITVRNNIQEKTLLEEKQVLLSFLGEKLANDGLQLAVVVDETIAEKKYFSEEDKLKIMIDKNPDLNLLRKKFDLDFE